MVDGAQWSRGMPDSTMTDLRSASPISTWYVDRRMPWRDTPSPVEALPCGSRSTISTSSPTAASAVPRLIAVVVLPTPPFWLAMARTRGDARLRSVAPCTLEPPDLHDAAAGIDTAR